MIVFLDVRSIINWWININSMKMNVVHINTIRFFVPLLFFVLCGCIFAGKVLSDDSIKTPFDGAGRSYDQKRNAYLGLLLKKKLPVFHYSGRQIDGDMSRNIFYLYLKGLDSWKCFLLQDDVKTLEAQVPRILDDLEQGKLTLPSAAFDIFTQRAGQVERMVDVLLTQPISATDVESIETDPKKFDYAKNEDELRDRWRRIVRGQVIKSFLDLEAKRATVARDANHLWAEAIQDVTSRNKEFFHRLRQGTVQEQYDSFYDALARAFDPHSGYYYLPANLSPSETKRFFEKRRPDAKRENGLQELMGLSEKRSLGLFDLANGANYTFAKSMVLNAPDGKKIGYILLPSFYHDFKKKNGSGRASGEDTRRKVEKLKAAGVDGIILDLRNNGGGALPDAVSIVDLFTDDGPVAQMKNAGGREQVLRDSEPGTVYAGPLITLVNGGSAGASEIVAAALQDYGRAVIVGDSRSYGYGTVQIVVDLDEMRLSHDPQFDNLGALQVTIQKFYRINGNSTQYKGVEPDILLPSMVGYIKSGEKYLEYSLPWDTISPVSYEKWQPPLPLDELRQRSEKRVAFDKAFLTIKEEAKNAEQRSRDTLITLTVDDMRAQKEAAQRSKKKMGEYFRQFRGAGDGEDEQPPPQEKRDEWMKNVREEPYIREAEHILLDMIVLGGKKTPVPPEKDMSDGPR